MHPGGQEGVRHLVGVWGPREIDQIIIIDQQYRQGSDQASGQGAGKDASSQLDKFVVAIPLCLIVNYHSGAVLSA